MFQPPLSLEKRIVIIAIIAFITAAADVYFSYNLWKDAKAFVSTYVSIKDTLSTDKANVLGRCIMHLIFLYMSVPMLATLLFQIICVLKRPEFYPSAYEKTMARIKSVGTERSPFGVVTRVVTMKDEPSMMNPHYLTERRVSQPQPSAAQAPEPIIDLRDFPSHKEFIDNPEAARRKIADLNANAKEFYTPSNHTHFDPFGDPEEPVRENAK